MSHWIHWVARLESTDNLFLVLIQRLLRDQFFRDLFWECLDSRLNPPGCLAGEYWRPLPCFETFFVTNFFPRPIFRIIWIENWIHTPGGLAGEYRLPLPEEQHPWLLSTERLEEILFGNSFQLQSKPSFNCFIFMLFHLFFTNRATPRWCWLSSVCLSVSGGNSWKRISLVQ